MTTSKKNVLAFLNAFWNYGAGMSGGDQMFIQVFKRIRRELGVLSCVTNPDGQRAIAAQVDIVAFYQSPAWFDRLGVMASYVLRTIWALGSLRSRPDVIYSGSDFFPDVVPAFLFKLFHPRVRWIQCVFHIYPYWRKRPGLALANFAAQYLQQGSLFLARHADTIVNINHEVKRYLIDKGFNEYKIIVNPPGVDFDRLRAIPPAPAGEGYDGIFLGRLSASKGIFDLLEIWTRVVQVIPQARLGIIGGGDPETVSELRTRIAASSLQHQIDILGYLPDERAFGLVKISKVLLFPSREEGFGIAIVEALACGIEVVAWDLEVFAEFFSDLIKTVPSIDYAAFAEAVITGLRKPETKRPMTASIEQFSWNRAAADFLLLAHK